MADRRRFNGPETSRPLRRAPREAAAPEPSTSERVGRKAGDIRPIFLRPGLTPQASGSCYIETGQAKVVCAVYGPHPARRDAAFSASARLNVEVRYAPFACRSRRRTPGKDSESAPLAAHVAQALRPALCLELMPKSVIDVFVTVIECDGPESDASLAVTAASAALAEAGVDMRGLVVGLCAGLTATDEVWLDPSYDDLPLCKRGLLSLAYLPAFATTTHLSFEGDIERSTLSEALLTMRNMADAIHAAVAQKLRDRAAETLPREDA